MRPRLLACSSRQRRWSPRDRRRRHPCPPCPVAAWVAWIIDRRRTSAAGKRARAIARALVLDVTVADDEPRSGDPSVVRKVLAIVRLPSGVAESPENADNRAALRANQMHHRR